MLFGVSFGVFFASLSLLFFMACGEPRKLDKADWIYVGFLSFAMFVSVLVMVLCLVIPHLLLIVG